MKFKFAYFDDVTATPMILFLIVMSTNFLCIWVSSPKKPQTKIRRLVTQAACFEDSVECAGDRD
ncbi:hypothetical protein A6R70_19175 [Agrobacterium rubi]|nr:hypothetical protein [Agrobacterium rubi]